MPEHQDTTASTMTAQVQPATQAPAQVSSAASTSSATDTAAAATATVANPQVNANAATSPSDELFCLWNECSKKCPTPEYLYEHICECHIGRKSTNNLNLTCQWGGCHTTTVKRDHITSHIRVHVPLKPHKCHFCGKAFKRPQDLKKHVKTHADDSVLVRSPEPGARDSDMISHGNPTKGYVAGADYFKPVLIPVPIQGGHNPPQYYRSHPPPQPANPSHGNVYYTLNDGHKPGNASYESKKRGYDALNEFFGDLKRRQFDLNSYTAVSHRLLGLQSLSLPILSGGPLPEYQPMPAPVAIDGGGHCSGGSSPAPAYHVSNVRTKNDLISIDQLLQQMQDTIYENDHNVAGVGVAQPGAHYINSGMSYCTTNSPPTQIPPMHASATTLEVPVMAHSPSMETPALTPPSGAPSYTLGRSPISLPSANRVSPPHHEGGLSMYPRLPSVTIPGSMTTGSRTASSAAPPSTLGGLFVHDDRRHYTGGTLQRARPDNRPLAEIRDPALENREDGERALPDKTRPTPSPPGRISANLIDSTLSSSPAEEKPTLRAAQTTTQVTERSDVQWAKKVRLIEYLRNYIAFRLERGGYEGILHQESGSYSPETGLHELIERFELESPVKSEERPTKAEADQAMYPTLRGVDDGGDSKMPS